MPDKDYRYGVRYAFSGDMDRLEDWLDAHCNGGYDYQLEDVKETESIFGKLEIIFRFERESDRDRFKALIVSGQAPW